MVYADATLRGASHCSVNTAWPVAVKSQTLTFPSAPREARCLPSGWNATLTTESACALGRVCITLPVLLFQILTVPSAPAEASPAPVEQGAAPTSTAEQQKLVSGAPLYNSNVAVHIVEQKRHEEKGRFEIANVMPGKAHCAPTGMEVPNLDCCPGAGGGDETIVGRYVAIQ